MKIMTILGARPQFIKAAPISKALLNSRAKEFILHTGQHYDQQMSEVFFEELEIPEPDVNLEIGSGSHGQQTGRMLEAIEEQILQEQPDTVLVYGDTNSTLAGALAAVKLGVHTAHVEAGLRSWNRTMPEEHNRILTDHCADILLCPTETAVGNLRDEGIQKGIHLVGDPMLDTSMHFLPLAREKSMALETLGLTKGAYFIATLHRPSNVDNPETLHRILGTLDELPLPVVFPVHPRTQSKLAPDTQERHQNIILADPLGYLDMLRLVETAHAVLTDSGGLQKEAFFLETPCITLREETEWTETLTDNANQVVGNSAEAISKAAKTLPADAAYDKSPFGDGTSAQKTAEILAA